MSNSQKYIFVISILNIIGGVFYLIIGVLGFMGKSIAGNEALIQQAGEESAPALVTAFIIMMILSGAFSLLLGFFRNPCRERRKQDRPSVYPRHAFSDHQCCQPVRRYLRRQLLDPVSDRNRSACPDVLVCR